MVIAETGRLVISEISIKEASFFVQLMNTPGFLKYVGDRNIKTKKDAEAYLKTRFLKSYEDHGFGYYKMALKEHKDRPLGVVGILKRDTLDDADVGFALLPEFEGKGYGYEASVEILKLAKEKFKMTKITAITDPENMKSIRLLERLGMTFEKRVAPFEADKELLLFVKDL